MKRAPFLVLFTLICLALTPCNVWPASRAGVVTMSFDLSSQEAGKDTRLWIPYPVSDSDQLIGDIKVSGNFISSAVYTDRVNGNPILYAYWDGKNVDRQLVLSVAVERLEVVHKGIPVKENRWDRANYKAYLGPTRQGPTDGDVKKLADKITKGKTTTVAKARAIYDWICDNMARDPNVRGCGQGNVCALLVEPKGKCTDISSVFVALCRAADVPAREVFGIRLGKKTEEDITGYQHCWAEFFVPGHGWVPADPADVLKARLVENLEPKDPKLAAYRVYFWGGIDPYRIKLSTGRDIELNPPQAGEPLNNFGYPFAQVGGTTVDWYAPDSFKYKMSFKEK